MRQRAVDSVVLMGSAVWFRRKGWRSWSGILFNITLDGRWISSSLYYLPLQLQRRRCRLGHLWLQNGTRAFVLLSMPERWGVHWSILGSNNTAVQHSARKQLRTRRRLDLTFVGLRTRTRSTRRVLLFPYGLEVDLSACAVDEEVLEGLMVLVGGPVLTVVERRWSLLTLGLLLILLTARDSLNSSLSNWVALPVIRISFTSDGDESELVTYSSYTNVSTIFPTPAPEQNIMKHGISE